MLRFSAGNRFFWTGWILGSWRPWKNLEPSVRLPKC